MIGRMRLSAAAFLLVSFGAGAAEPVLAPGSPYGGRTLEQLSARWWQWVMSVPGESNPLKDATGANCGAGQDGDVWFLAGGTAPKIKRVCEVPAGKAILFPLAQRGDRNRTCEQARAGAALTQMEAVELTVEVDGVAVPSPKRYRVTTQECFDVYAKVSPMLGKAEPHPSASDGYWFLVPPLAKGRHTVKFAVRYNDFVPLPGRADQEVEYELKVQ